MRGAGAYAYVDGLVDVSMWADGSAVGDGVRWSSAALTKRLVPLNSGASSIEYHIRKAT